MSWIRATVKTAHLFTLLLVCFISLYSLGASSQQSPSAPVKQDEKMGALTIVHSEEEDQDDGVVVQDIDEEITIENDEVFHPTNMWQEIKPGQAIPTGLHVRLNMETGKREARLMQKEDGSQLDAPEAGSNQGSPESEGEKEYISLDELKKAVKSMKSEKFKSHDMKTLQKERNFRSYEELKEDLESMNAGIKTDAEVITELVEHFRSLSDAEEDVTAILEQLEYYLHQIDNAMLFCDLGAMPLLLRCLNSSKETVRSKAALTLGAALQSNPKVQVLALENGAMHDILRLLAIDTSRTVRKHAMYALSTMVRHFPFAQKRFLELGGLSVLGRIFEDKSAEDLQVRAVTLLADLIKEKSKHTEHLNPEDSTEKERFRQYQQVALQEAMVESGWCAFIPSLLHVPGHDSREKVLVAMETVFPACHAAFHPAVPVLRKLQEEYTELLQQERAESGEDDGFFRGMVSIADSLLARLPAKDEL